ncbi:MAG: mandelate racemase [Bacillota bacterium]|jgi:D-galactarolactone cycloisomerase|nr:mandelate racemase [Bacillota bacterium]
MKIADIKAYPVSFNLAKPFYNSVDRFYKRSVTLVKVIADDGTYGWGDAYGPAASGAAKMIETYLKERLIGQDPFRVEYLWHVMQNKKGFPIGILGGVDIALWDLKARKLEVPLYELLGGKYFDEFTPYASGLPYREDAPDSMDAMIQEVEAILPNGFKSLKMKVGFGKEQDTARIAKVREMIGNDMKLMVDANQAYTISTCLEMLPVFEKYNIAWLEEPLPWQSNDSYKLLRARTNIPIAAGEWEITMQGFINAAQNQICDIIQPDLPAVGGITAMKRIAALAFANNIALQPHAFGTIVSLPAALQFMAAQPSYHSWATFPEGVTIEWDTNPNNTANKLIKEPLQLKNGAVKLPEKPGIGIEINEDALGEFIETY